MGGYNMNEQTSGKNLDMFTLAERNKPRRLLYKRDLQPINNLKTIFFFFFFYFAGNVNGII
jgi:type I restriction enzyme M protein